MRLTKKLETEILKVYYAYWDAYLKGDMKTFASFLDENVTVYGTAAGEVFTNKKEAVKFYTITADQMTGKADFRKRRVKVKTAGNTVVVNEECDLYVLIDGVWTFYDHARITAIIEKKGNAWKCVHQHGSFPDTRTEEGDQIATEKIKKENLQLKEAVKRRTTELEEKNRELEIETALEKVRAVAMSMKRREDMLQICKTISLQLANLGVKEIRNVQTAIFKVPAGTYMNYEYYAKHNKTFITETLYTNHKVARTFAAKMLKGKGEVSITHIKGKQKVKEWLNYQKGTNVFIDTWLNTATSLSYYWYSLGPVALGISTYVPLTKEEQQLFCRFLKVFELAYRRYLDIEKAEAQAREAQIEAALERIRAASLAMRDSSALSTIIFRLYAELTKLDAKLDRCFIMIVNPENKGITWWMAGQEGLLAENGFFVQMNQHPSHLMYLDNSKKRKKKWTYLFEGKEKRDWDRFGFSKTELARLPEPVKVFMASAKKVYLSGSSDQFGSLVTGSFEPLPQEQQEIISRFTIAFNQAYTRFLDLQKAEAQTREAQIEAALERVRAAAMSMHRSEELLNVCEVLYKEIRALGFNILRNAMINIHNDEKKSFINYDYSDEIGRSTNHLVYNIHPLVEKQIGTIRSADDAFSETYFTGRDLTTWKNFRKRIGEKNDSRLDKNKGLYYYFYSIGIGSIGISTFGPISDEKKALLKRFRNVFALSYQRYFDIAKAEAQAREAQIELALERVRARTMAMQHSEELSETVTVMFEQFKELGEEPERMAIEIVNEKDHVFEIWATQHGGSQLNLLVRLSLDEPHVMQKMYKAWKAKTKSITIDLQGKELEQYFNYLKKQKLPVKRKIFGKRRVQNVATFSKGILTIITPEPRPQETIDLLERFASVFDGTYTRFLDLQKAEAQAREAQIETAMERVRSRTMAMQNSNELPQAANLLFQQVQSLGMPAWSAGYCIWDDDKKGITLWMSSEGVMQPSFHAPLTKDPSFIHMREAYEKGQTFHVEEVGGKELVKHYKYMRTLPVVGDVLDSIIEAGHPLPVFQIFHCVYFSQGFLLFITYEPVQAAHEIFKRFGNVFDQTYTRFLDLRKAEAQAREAQIEVSLERVRSRTMAMHKSEDLSETSVVLFNELKKLGIQTTRSGFGIYDEANQAIQLWLTTVSGQLSEQSVLGTIPLKAHYAIHENYTAWKEKKLMMVHTFSGTEVKEYYQKIGNYLSIAPQKKYPERLVFSVFFFSEGSLNVMTEEPLTDDDNKIMLRFSNVFGLTYRRFLDLQKAEAQAREAQIEAALERVRSRSMGMQKSDELQEVIKLVYEQLRHLKIKLDHAGFVVDYKPKGDWTFWIADEQDIPSKISHPYFESVWANQFDEAKENGKDLFATHLNFEEKNKFYDELLSYVPGLPEASKDFYLSCPGLAASTVLLDDVSLYIENFSGTPYSDEDNKTLMRFGKVFQQTYTRFLDLQKAEAQAREAKIEAALEKVRARTMSMQQSNELGDVATVLFKEMNQLVKNLWTCGFVLCEKDRNEDEWWLSTENGFIPAFYLPNTGDRVHENLYTGWNKGEVYLTEQVEGAELDQHYEWLMNIPVTKKIFDDFEAAGFEKPGWQKLHAAYFSKGYLCIITREPCPEEDVFKRFAQVFDLTYTRFLDLQKAESQARQAKIETALEKVRARALAMQQPEELTEVAQVMRYEMGLLGVEELETSSIYIHEENSDKAECWYAIKDIRIPEKKLVAGHFILNLKDTWVGRQMFTFYQSSEKQASIPMQGVKRKEWINYCSRQSKQLEGFYGDTIPDRTYHLYKFSNGTIGAATPGNISTESWDLLQRAASAFSLAYSRFKDLTQARIDLQRLKEEKQRAEDALAELQVTQKQLIQSEKMASLGELTAGIAHEIQNPLNFVNNFSEVSKELLQEMKEAVEKGDVEDAKEIMNDVIQNLEKINHHGKRADGIVKGMLQHSRSSSGQKEMTDINALCDEYLRLAYHGLRAKDKSFNAIFETQFENSLGKINVMPQEIGRVVLNLINNAFYAVSERKKLNETGYEPTVSVSTIKAGNTVVIGVRDNGTGIPQRVLDKIFQPFFTTKPTGLGTGLGLSLSYDIITKGHGGELKVETKEGQGTEFFILLPL